MNTNSTILITGAAGFIAGCMAAFLNEKGYKNLILMDDFSRQDKQENFERLQSISRVERNTIDTFIKEEHAIDFVIHFGARTDTTEMDYSIHEELNLNFSKKIWKYCAEKNIPLIYASSAATYGDGELGYDDNHELVEKLQPLNPYGVSKNEFDKFVLHEIMSGAACPPNWYGLKFFNVYGPHENHKGRMASVVFHAFHQIKKNGSLKLFRSHNPDYEDGGQMRDFIYVKDVLEVTWWLMNSLPADGIYNLGSGVANTFLQLAHAIFKSMNEKTVIEFIDTPIDIREKYQYYTKANMQKLKDAGYTNRFYSIEDGVADYVKYLMERNKN